MVNESVFFEISQSKAADQAARQIEELILEGVLRQGDRLPSERDLAQHIHISRPILRAAIKHLENIGLLKSKAGGGTFVAQITGEIFTPPIIDLIKRHPKATLDYLEYRRAIEATATELAATKATTSDKELLSQMAQAMTLAHQQQDAEREAQLDIELHNLIGECAHNVVLLHNLRSSYQLLSDGVVFNRMMIFGIDGARDRLLAQHLSIIETIIKSDPVMARQAAQLHIDFIIDGFKDAQNTEEREQISQLRLKQRLGS